MIRYSLHCDRGHEFEGWFASSADHDRQRERGLLDCPECGSKQVEKSLMAPAVATRRDVELPPARSPEAPDPASSVSAVGLSGHKREMLRQMRELRARILSGAEDVGERFPEEARKIHYGEAEARGIYGKTDLGEAIALAEEGIELLPLPDLPDDQN